MQNQQTINTKKNKCGISSHIFHQNWLAQAREAEASTEASTFVQLAALVVIPTQQAKESFTFMQPATVPAGLIQPSVTMTNQTQEVPRIFCNMHTSWKEMPYRISHVPHIRLVTLKRMKKKTLMSKTKKRRK